jgi:hypothetical protein
MHAVAAVKAVSVGLLVTQAGCYIWLCMPNTPGGVFCLWLLWFMPTLVCCLHALHSRHPYPWYPCSVELRAMLCVVRILPGFGLPLQPLRDAVWLAGAAGTGMGPIIGCAAL